MRRRVRDRVAEPISSSPASDEGAWATAIDAGQALNRLKPELRTTFVPLDQNVAFHLGVDEVIDIILRACVDPSNLTPPNRWCVGPKPSRLYLAVEAMAIPD